MFISPYIKKAIYFAAKEHDGQYRKGGKIPYIVHPIQVALEVSKYTNDEKIIAAAFLHDVLEDCHDISITILKKEFGNQITKLVKEISHKEIKKSTTWEKKKEAYLKKIKKASKDALIIVAIDKINNFQAYFDALKEKGKKIKCDFGGTPDEYRWYYTEIEKILISKLDKHPIVKDYTAIWQSYKNENL